MICSTPISKYNYLDNAWKSRYNNHISQSETNNNVMWIWNLGEGFTCKDILRIPYKKTGRFYLADYSICSYVISVAEESYGAMQKDFILQLKDAYNYYAFEDDSRLTKGARAVKQWMLANIAKE